jgi:hypothetical protein
MANEIREKVTFDDSAVIKGLTDQYALVTKVNLALRDTEMSYKEAFQVAQKEMDESSKAIDDNKKKIVENIVETNKAKQAAGGWKDAMRGLANEVNILGVNLGSTISGLRAKAAAMKSVVSSVNAGSNAMKVFKIALVSTGIGALVVALGSLAAMLSRSEGAMKKVNQVLSGIGAVVDLLITRFAKIGDAVVKVFQGNFKGAMESATAATTGLTSAIGKQFDAAVKLEKKIQDLEATNRSLALSTEFVKGRIDALVDVYNDQTKGAEERIAALKEAAKLDVENLKLLEEAAIQATANEVQRQKIAYGTINDQKALNEFLVAQVAAQNAVKAAEDQYLKKTSGLEVEIATQRAAAAAERLAQIKAANDALQTQIDKIQAAYQSIQLDKLSPEERLQAEAELSRKIVAVTFERVKELAKAAGKEVDLSKEKAAILLKIEEDLVKSIKEVREKNSADVAKIETIAEKESRERREASIAGMGDIKPSTENQVVGAFKSLGEKIANALGIDADVFDAILKGLGPVLDAVFELTNANTDAAIEKNNELLDSIRERQDLLNDDLEKEKERQAAGLANSLDAKQKERQILKKEEEEALKEQEKLRKKQLAQQLVEDGLSQASGIVSMAINVTKGTSLLGPAGIPIALATIAAFLSIISKIKASSKKLYTGGPLDQEGVTGFVNRSGRTDRNGGRGHRVEDSNLILGGREFVVNESTSMKHAAFLEALNRGEFDNGDGLHFAMGHTREMEHSSAIVNALSSRNNSAGMAEAIDRAVGRHIGALAGVIKSQPRKFSYTPGDIVVEERDGLTKITQTEPDWRWVPEKRG